MKAFHKHIIYLDTSINESLERLNVLNTDVILFIADSNNKLMGSLTDGDLRRGFIKGLGMNNHLSEFMNIEPKFIQQGKYNLKEIIALREIYINVFPVVNSEMQIVNIVNFRLQKSYLPVDALIMAGGRGERLRPLTDTVPKPLLHVGGKAIIEHNIDRLNAYGIDDIWISLNYLGEQIVDYFEDGNSKSVRIKYVWEEDALGTAGALGLVDGFIHEHILMMNSDLLTNINFEDFYIFMEEVEADFAVACIPYQVNVPYAVMETIDNKVVGFKEKPTYTHYSNAGIYLMKREVINLVPKHKHFNATDLMEILIAKGKKVVSYPLVGYWLDIGKHEDYNKAQLDFAHVKF
jgi:dTDP-glucose pyrophosphorylase